MAVLDWLLEDGAPGVQYLTRERLLGEDPESRRMRSLRRRCNEDSLVARLLDRVDECVAPNNVHSSEWKFLGYYNKYRGVYWTLIFLADMHADVQDPRVRKLADHVLAAQLDDGGSSASGTPR
jgi:hypothetical protein